jgi:hypothetical protein
MGQVFGFTEGLEQGPVGTKKSVRVESAVKSSRIQLIANYPKTSQRVESYPVMKEQLPEDE